MEWLNQIHGDPLSWLLEADNSNPAIRYFTLRDLLERPVDDPSVQDAKRAIMTDGPVPVILQAQHPDGYWLTPNSGYRKYQGASWQIIFLAELGADPTDERVRKGCDYLLRHTIAPTGGFACTNTPTASGVIHCLNGNLLTALIYLGYLEDPHLQEALQWEVYAITGEDPGIFRRSGTSGPLFSCAANGHQPCAWGAVKAMKALLAVPSSHRTPAMTRALEQGAAFLLGYDVATAAYPYTEKVSSAWFKPGFPLSYWSDLIEALTVLAGAGYQADPRLAEAYRWLLSKQDDQGRWKLENSLNRKMWVDIEKRGKPGKWVTLRALRVVKAMETNRHEPIPM